MKKILTFALAVSMMASLAASASALEYSIAPPKDFDFGGDTSIEVIHTADGGAMKHRHEQKCRAYSACFRFGEHERPPHR